MQGRGQANQLWPPGKDKSTRNGDTSSCEGGAEGKRGLKQVWGTPGNWFPANLKQTLIQTWEATPRPFSNVHPCDPITPQLDICHKTVTRWLCAGCPFQQCWKDQTMTVRVSVAGPMHQDFPEAMS